MEVAGDDEDVEEKSTSAGDQDGEEQPEGEDLAEHTAVSPNRRGWRGRDPHWEKQPEGEDLGGPEGEALWTPRAPGHLTRKVRGVHRAGWPVALGRRTRWPQRCRTSLRRSPAEIPRGGAREGDSQEGVL